MLSLENGKPNGYDIYQECLNLEIRFDVMRFKGIRYGARARKQQEAIAEPQIYIAITGLNNETLGQEYPR